MSFNSFDRLLSALENQPNWANYRRYKNLCQCWEMVVEPQIVGQTRLLFVQRNVLWVATSSAVWAQTLSLKRYFLLKKLNSLVTTEPLEDLRFSSVGWHRSPNMDKEPSEEEKGVLPQHPSFIPSLPTRIDPQDSKSMMTPEIAFERWTQVIQQRSQSLPLCPQCNSPTPPGELERWSKCSICAVESWQKNV
jgi:predicted nucleic acid-binding Zn ribbon protein